MLFSFIFLESASAQSKAVQLRDLPPAEQSSISAALGQDMAGYHATAQRNGVHMSDLRHRLAADFTANGVAMHFGAATWHMTLSAYGRANTLKPLRSVLPEVEANRVRYRRGPVTEWYVNGPLGLEQGFTLREAVGKSSLGPLTLALALAGNVRPIEKDRTTLSLAGEDGEAKLSYTGLVARDAAGRELPAWFEVKAKQLLVRVDDRGAHYPVVIDPWVQVAEVIPSDGENNDEFGWSVGAANNTVVVGAPFHAVGSNTAQGAAYVFVESPSGWGNMTQTAELLASDGAANAYFGTSVSIYGTTIVVGAGGTTINGNPRQGAAYVFVEPSGGWTNMTETAELTASDGYVGDSLGDAVAINGNTVIAGAPYANVGSNAEQGAAYVFVEPGSGWSNMTQTAKLTASDGAAGDILGVAVAISGGTVVAGAPEANVGGNASAGAGYVFVEGTGGWTDMNETAKLTASDAAVDDYFGAALDTDGMTIVVGAPSDFSGAVYVYIETGNGWVSATQNAELTPSNPTSKLLLGTSVAIGGTLIAAGAPGAAPNNSQGEGEVFVFVEAPNGWSNMNETTRVTSSDGAAGDNFGRSISIGAYAGAIGAPFHVNSGKVADGSSYVFQAVNQRPSLTTLKPDSTTAGGSNFTLTVIGTNFVNGTVINWDQSPRTTTFISSTKVQATILASDIATAGEFHVTATNPPPGGGPSTNALIFTVNNPVPSIQSLSPDSAVAGGPAFTLTVAGSNFVSNSKVLWNGTQLQTTFVSSSKLTALVGAHQIQTAGTVQVTVNNPAPGGGTSNAETFTVDNPVPNLTELVPNSIRAGSSGFTLKVKGTNFVSTSQVFWNGSPRQTTYDGPQSVSAAILASDIQNPGTAQVTASNPGPGGGTSNSLPFTINK